MVFLEKFNWLLRLSKLEFKHLTIECFFGRLETGSECFKHGHHFTLLPLAIVGKSFIRENQMQYSVKSTALGLVFVCVMNIGELEQKTSWEFGSPDLYVHKLDCKNMLLVSRSIWVSCIVNRRQLLNFRFFSSCISILLLLILTIFLFLVPINYVYFIFNF